ncbi:MULTISPECIES: cytochrome oxidase putative small subunit CydP [unclassified Herbaspirillum]|uniref:cytochrome oxidase putative small subunit CydP n=1 Tax=unclassified Herbaspirillum TaxID=2624150 RepID=UPI00117329D9|nr:MULTISPECIES: cytochrome oxidase putative small subunit CydP [unclassified Herbaspirillum]MBB5390881.1 hypothetical protein [Herbaspirillum sp. SJZ102]TQK06405.1 hypothetical protein FB599_2554 [Herbaspirillum sp. SJZ130]TQK12117.1 hypothetical protein FB598_2065 [Herbaspirillum sp. SJZ106]TWC64556.1 hypothetical protein FB597_10843 [Herbaspirillum sp. SJZ099]
MRRPAPSVSDQQRPPGLRRLRIPRLTQLPLGAEITLLLVVKIALITILSKTFFAHPEAKHMRMPTASVEARMLAPAAPDTQVPALSSETSNTSEVNNASNR